MLDSQLLCQILFFTEKLFFRARVLSRPLFAQLQTSFFLFSTSQNYAECLSSFIRKSHERTHSAMMVSVGFWQGFDVKPEASIT
jgi:hypothetical protein